MNQYSYDLLQTGDRQRLQGSSALVFGAVMFGAVLVFGVLVLIGDAAKAGPTIIVLGRNPTVVALSDADDFNDPGADCTDPEFGNISEMVEIDSPDVDKAGTYKITYSCKNPKGLAVSAARTFIVKNKLAAGDVGPAPQIRVKGGNPVRLTLAMVASYKDKGVSCSDAKYGNIVPKTSTPKMKAPGDYTMYYTCANPSGYTSTASRLVVVTKRNTPVITLKGKNPYVFYPDDSKGAKYTDPGAKCVDPKDGDITSCCLMSLCEDNACDKPGTHYMSFTCDSKTGVSAEQVRRTIVVMAAPKVKKTLSSAKRSSHDDDARLQKTLQTTTTSHCSDHDRLVGDASDGNYKSCADAKELCHNNKFGKDIQRLCCHTCKCASDNPPSECQDSKQTPQYNRVVRLEASFEGKAAEFSEQSRENLARAFAMALHLPLTDAAVGHPHQSRMGSPGSWSYIVTVPVRVQFPGDQFDRQQVLGVLNNSVLLASKVESKLKAGPFFEPKALMLTAPLSIRKEIVDAQDEDVFSQLSRVSLMIVVVVGAAAVCFANVAGQFKFDAYTYHRIGTEKRNRSLADCDVNRDRSYDTDVGSSPPVGL